MNSKKHIVVLTGAGISAESGLKTFRDSVDGLWNGYDIEEVATPNAWHKNPALVLDFYNYRRSEVLKAEPNAAHKGLAALEQFFNVTIITQNIDDLHERGGSTNVIHLHGEILKMRSERNETKTYPITGDIQIGDKAADGFQLRPHIVWFGEAVPMIELASDITATADAFVVVGTSLNVYPAAGLLHYAPAEIPKFIVDKHIPDAYGVQHLECIEQPATIGIELLTQKLLALK
ncbi:MAG TPA: Sir2 family NAD-dependent protein deacetylase [Phnomibacter sp.]|nr:Sir2 family NAD-dependent protein deacetylase [Phnomibacter sp.]